MKDAPLSQLQVVNATAYRVGTCVIKVKELACIYPYFYASKKA